MAYMNLTYINGSYIFVLERAHYTLMIWANDTAALTTQCSTLEPLIFDRFKASKTSKWRVKLDGKCLLLQE